MFFLKNYFLLIKSKIHNIQNSFFYALIILFCIISFISSIIIYTTQIIYNINQKTKVIQYNNNNNTIYNKKLKNQTIKIENKSFSRNNYSKNNIINRTNKNIIITNDDAEKLFAQFFNSNMKIIEKNTTTKNIDSKKYAKKKIIKQQQQKLKKIDNIKKKKDKDISVNKENIIKIKTTKKEIINNTLCKKENIFIKNTLKLNNYENKNKILNNQLENRLENTNDIKSIILNEDELNEFLEIEDNNININEKENNSDESEESQNELLEYTIRLKKHIKQFPGKKEPLEITILLENSNIKDIIFSKKLFSLAYKMYIINILKKIDIPKILWNQKLLISL